MTIAVVLSLLGYAVLVGALLLRLRMLRDQIRRHENAGRASLESSNAMFSITGDTQ